MFEITFFQYGPITGVFKPFQIFFFQSKNSNRSKQTTAKGKQIENQGYGLVYKPKGL